MSQTTSPSLIKGLSSSGQVTSSDLSLRVLFLLSSHPVSNHGRQQEDHGEQEAEEGGLYGGGSEGQDYHVSTAGEDTWVGEVVIVEVLCVEIVVLSSLST